MVIIMDNTHQVNKRQMNPTEQSRMDDPKTWETL